MRAGLPVLPAGFRWGIVGLVAAGILLASVLDAAGAASLGPFGILRSDKYAHAAGYAGLAVAVAYAMAHHGGDPTVVAVAFLAAAAFGLGIELLQLGLPHRSFDPADVAANAAGAALAVGAWRVLARRVRLCPVLGARPRGAIGTDAETRD